MAEALLPETGEIRKDLGHMTARWHELPDPVVFELRAFKEGAQPQTAKFAPDWIDEAVDWAESMNALGFNIYAVRNPIRHDVSGSAKDTDIVAAFFLWADCDDDGAADNVRRFDGPKVNAAVITGRTPGTRVHTYWELAQPVTDMTEWRAMQETIAAHFGSDKTVVNPSRIMRVAGTVSYPDSKKQARGYAKEVCAFKSYGNPNVTIDQMRRVFGAAKPKQALEIDTGPQPLDRERTRIQALEGNEWHNAVIRLVGSYVSRGLSDDEIHGLTDPLTLPGYTVDQTRREVQTAIDGARRKGWTPETPPVAALQSAQAEAPKPQLEWFDEVQIGTSSNYLIKGFLDQETVSVVYGPSNSGKTFFVLDMAYHLAAGLEWRGRKVKQCAVLYLAAEGGRGIVARIVALRQHTGASGIPFAVRRGGLDLLRSEADLNSIVEFTKEISDRAPGLPIVIVVDTLSRVMAGGDENGPVDMTQFVANMDALRAITGAHICIVHHSGKDTAKGARGHSSLRAAVDTEIEIAPPTDGDSIRTATDSKQREHESDRVFPFALKAIDLGVDDEGDEITTCVIEHLDDSAAPKRQKPLGKNQKKLLQAFDQMLGEGLGRPNPGGVAMPEAGKFWTVPADDLREVFYGKTTASNKRGAFLEAFDALTGPDGPLCMASGLVWHFERKVSRRD